MKFFIFLFALTVFTNTSYAASKTCNGNKIDFSVTHQQGQFLLSYSINNSPSKRIPLQFSYNGIAGKPVKVFSSCNDKGHLGIFIYDSFDNSKNKNVAGIKKAMGAIARSIAYRNSVYPFIIDTNSGRTLFSPDRKKNPEAEMLKRKISNIHTQNIKSFHIFPSGSDFMIVTASQNEIVTTKLADTERFYISDRPVISYKAEGCGGIKKIEAEGISTIKAYTYASQKKYIPDNPAYPEGFGCTGGSKDTGIRYINIF